MLNYSFILLQLSSVFQNFSKGATKHNSEQRINHSEPVPVVNRMLDLHFPISSQWEFKRLMSWCSPSILAEFPRGKLLAATSCRVSVDERSCE